ncbi:hypothetical protein NCCP2222_11180 [Sporosarcina sp. NCCP-2222]|nr:hypothetical protein [Sporosarcina sp. NCCP-2222]GKV55171.1 hypothetical protein NCCP2222_11180 [Sporosarcina sp. NCCP-2222]
MIKAKKAAAVDVMNAIDERQEIIDRVNDWTDRMFELRKTQGK